MIEAVNVGQYLGSGQVPLLAPAPLAPHQDGHMMQVDMGRVMAIGGDTQLKADLARDQSQ